MQAYPTEEGLKLLQPGQITFAVMARNATNEPNRLIAASIGVATPADAAQYGYLSEHHPYGETDEKAGEYAEDLAATMLATTLGVEFDPNIAWDEREKHLQDEREDRPDLQRDAVGRRAQGRALDDRRRVRDPASLVTGR